MFQAPVIPDDIEAADLDKEVRSELLSLSRDVSDRVARHLVAAGQVIDEDAGLALEHAVAARRLASRIGAVREAVGLAAYAAGDWATAIAELRTYHRMSGTQTHLAEIADCERALGRPERAIDLFRGADRAALGKAGDIELLIVAAGARGDLGQHDAAVAMLQVPELTTDEDADWAARLRYAYADGLLAAGRRDEAREWFSRAAAVDEDGITDAAERLLELDGVEIEGDDHDDEDDEDTDGHEEAGQVADGHDDDDTDDAAAGIEENPDADLDDDEDDDLDPVTDDGYVTDGFIDDVPAAGSDGGAYPAIDSDPLSDDDDDDAEGGFAGEAGKADDDEFVVGAAGDADEDLDDEDLDEDEPTQPGAAEAAGPAATGPSAGSTDGGETGTSGAGAGGPGAKGTDA